ncbi:MAG: cell division topological specificity factor MinE [Buchnera aphidicola (Eriosoma harunire)]
MSIINFFLLNNKHTANIAKQRLKIIITSEQNKKYEPDYFPMLKNDILLVLSKYVMVDYNMVNITLDQKNKDISILEMNITLPQ